MFEYLYKNTNIVVKGNQFGRVINYPTMNTDIEKGNAIPQGSYLSILFLDNEYYLSLTNIGVHPTIDELHKPLSETYVFGFSDDAYGKTITVYLIKQIRKEKKFQDISKLRKQIYRDEKKAFKLIKNIHDLPPLKNYLPNVNK